MVTELKKARLEKNLTQKEIADHLGVSLRSYIMYENDESRTDTLKYRYFLQEVEKMNMVDENHGILEIDRIKTVCSQVFNDFQIDFCYLFGSYAKGAAREESDVDLLISSNETGLRFYELTENLRQTLHKRVDVLDVRQLVNNEVLLREVLKDGIKIYG